MVLLSVNVPAACGTRPLSVIACLNINCLSTAKGFYRNPQSKTCINHCVHRVVTCIYSDGFTYVLLEVMAFWTHACSTAVTELLVRILAALQFRGRQRAQLTARSHYSSVTNLECSLCATVRSKQYYWNDTSSISLRDRTFSTGLDFLQRVALWYSFSIPELRVQFSWTWLINIFTRCDTTVY